MSFGGLNPALNAWREGIVARFPDRSAKSDGGFADEFHSSSSRHQPDPDGTVDAFDCDVNFFGSDVESGNQLERRFAEAAKADFQNDPRAQLWIHQRKIANADVDDWRRRKYTGENPHDKHIHFQSRQSKEDDDRPWKMPITDALLAEIEDDMTPAQFLALLNDDAVAARIRQLAGQGVHNQRLGASDETIGQDLQSDDKVIAARFDRLERKVDQIAEAVNRNDG